MAELRTEEEQVEALQRWWKENGTSLLLGIAVAIAGVVGWNYYQDQLVIQDETASAHFQRMLGYAEMPELGEGERANIRQDAVLLKQDYSDSAYAAYAALMLAKVSVQEDNLQQAEVELRWLLDNSDVAELQAVASVRLAQLLLAQGQADQALALLVDQDDAWQGRRLEVKGDVLLAQGDTAAAREAYEQAKQIGTEQGSNIALLGLKLDDLAN